MLHLSGVSKQFGGLHALENVSFSVKPGAIMGLIGPNGSGKTTLFNVISGYYKLTSGTVELAGKEITNLPAHKIAYQGISRTFQIVKPFNHMTVLENVLAGAFLRHNKRREARKKALEAISILNLNKYGDVFPLNLPLAIKKRMEIARALATSPKILLLDEVMGGLNPVETDQLIRVVLRLNDQGITIIIIEHKMRCIMSLAHEIVVLNNGQKIAQGYPEEIGKNKDVIKAYLGEEYNAERS